MDGVSWPTRAPIHICEMEQRFTLYLGETNIAAVVFKLTLSVSKESKGSHENMTGSRA